jgi:Tfp pilus assembly protein PilV
MVAMSILAIGLLSAAQLIPVALMHTRQGQVRTNAVEVAQRRVDALRASEFTSTALAAGTYTSTEDGYNLVWTITDSIPVPKSKMIVLTSSWNTSTGVKEATLTTYVTPLR